MSHIIEFKGEYAWLSNMYETPIVYQGLEYRSTENAYQAMKSIDISDRILFTNVSPKVSKGMGKKVKMRPDWDTVKLSIMTELQHIKYRNPELRAKLLATGNVNIIEGNTWKDEYWGVNINTGNGKNHLGVILMELRNHLRSVAYMDSIVAKHGSRVFAKYNAGKNPNNVYIGRGSIYGNPFKTNNSKTLVDRTANCISYREYLADVIRTNSNPQLIQAVKDLAGKNVVCFCSNGTTSTQDGARYCHGHVLLSACEYLNKGE